jgi:hypothetical protein
MESVKPDGWDYFAYKYYSDYNKQKDVNDAFVFELPRDWPLRWDGGCQNPLTFNLWLGKVVGIKPTATFLETASELEVEAEQLLWRLDQWDFIRITEKPKAVWYDAPEGAIVNAQVWIKIPLTIIAYNTLPDPVPPPFTPPPLISYNYEVVTELPTTIAEGKIVLFNGTLWRGLLEGESSLEAGTPWPVKGYKELVQRITNQNEYEGFTLGEEIVNDFEYPFDFPRLGEGTFEDAFFNPSDKLLIIEGYVDGFVLKPVITDYSMIKTTNNNGIPVDTIFSQGGTIIIKQYPPQCTEYT